MPPLSRSNILFFYPIALTADEIDGFIAHLFDRGVPTVCPDAVPLPFSSENPPPLVRVIFFLNLSQINYLILSFKHDIYPPHQVDADLPDSTGEYQKQTAGDDVEGHGIPLTEPITSNPIGSNMVIRTDATAEADTQHAKKPRAPSMRRILAPKYVMLLTCILLLVTSVHLF
jgi:hypothetical protein